MHSLYLCTGTKAEGRHRSRWIARGCAGIGGIARGAAGGSTRGGDLHGAVTLENAGVSARG
jgi:hypothetical protein